MGVPFERRGARFDDYVEAMNKVWSGEVVEHKSDFLDWSGFKSHPLPIQTPFPVVIGGSKGKAFERVARFGQGWYAPTANIDQLSALLPSLDAACEAAGRDRSSVEISCMWVPGLEGPEVVQRYAELGVSRLITLVPVIAGGGDPVDGLRRFGDEMLPKLA